MLKLKVSAKCSDLCWVEAADGDQFLGERSDYVPEGLGIGGGDYIELEINAATGQILNWTPLDAETIKEALHG